MPIYAALFLIVTFASIGVPGTNGFVGEFMVITGTYRLASASRSFAGSRRHARRGRRDPGAPCTC